MCFSPEISGAFAVIMWTYAFMWRKGPFGARACVAYFAAMETLQAAQYAWIDQCNHPMNKALTVVGFVHLAFQPFFANWYLSAFMTKGQRKYVPLILALSLFAGILSCNRLWMTDGDFPCSYGIEPLCGQRTCTFRGNVHLAWQMPMQHADQDYFTVGFSLHFFMFYLPTFALGMWPLTLFLLFSGPFFGRVLTSHQDEIPAIWCFVSIAQMFIPLLWSYFTKTAMFKAQKEAAAVHANGNGHANGHANGNGHSNGHANGNGHAANKPSADEEDPLANPWNIVIRGALLTAALTAKRYATLAMATGVPDMAVQAARAAVPAH